MAAGLGFKTFNTGDVLTAADVNGYLMQGVWVFASAAARTSAVTSPQEGNMSYLKDTNSLEYYSGSAWVAVGGSGGDFVKINTYSPSGSSGQSADSVFSSTYTSYRIMVSNITASTGVDILFRLRASGSDNSTANSYIYKGAVAATSVTVNNSSSNTLFITEGQATNASFCVIDIANPFTASETQLLSYAWARNTPRSFWTGSYHNQTVSYDGFTIYPSSGTFSGKIVVYGYKE